MKADPEFASLLITRNLRPVSVRICSPQPASSGGGGPATLPQSGSVSYLGTSWLVASFVAIAPARIYMLVQPS